VLNRVIVDPEHGTIDSPLHPSQVEIISGAPEALAALTGAGYGLVIISNQPALAKGKTTRKNLEQTHERVLELVQSRGGRILSSHICWHRAEDNCGCRKPKTGLIEEAFQQHGGYSLEGSWMVGDGVTDVQAGFAYGLRTAFLGSRKSDAVDIFEKNGALPTLWAQDLLDFAARILRKDHGEEVQEVMADSFSKQFLDESIDVIRKLDADSIERVAVGLAGVRSNGRLFILGVGGSAGHASHAVNDFRKICGFEAYAPTDNVSELTARINDDGWDTCFAEWLRGSRLGKNDAVLVFSVGGGSREKNISVNLVRALEAAKQSGAKIFGVVGKEGGFTRQVADACIVIPVVSPERITAHTEGLCSVVWHLLVSHPALKMAPTKWESV
jgi:D-sedoheptulose 7-phosphate isomerase